MNLYSGSIGAHITTEGALYVTSSQEQQIYSSLVALSGAVLYTASIDAYNDLHVYDWRVSASLSQSNELLTAISGAIIQVSGAITEEFETSRRGSNALYVTSSQSEQIYSSLVALSGATLYTASIDSYNDLHTYDWRTSASIIQVSSAIVNEFVTSRRGSEALYVTSSLASPVYEIPMYTRCSMSINETNADVGLTASNYDVYQYKYFCLQFSNMLNCTASISGTMDSAYTEWIPITADIAGYHTITGSCIIAQDTPIKWERVRVNYSKSITTNSVKVFVSLYN